MPVKTSKKPKKQGLTWSEKMKLEDKTASSPDASVGTIIKKGIEYRVTQDGELVPVKGPVAQRAVSKKKKPVV